MSEAKVIAFLKSKKRLLMAELQSNGGRGVELANAIDRLDLAIDALKGNLWCPHCQARLTSGVNT